MVTQGGPLSPMIFNVVVDAVIQHWVTVVVDPQEGARQEGIVTPIQTLLDLFYAQNGLITSPKSAFLQGTFGALMGLFDRVGLGTNKENTVSMACMTCHTPHAWSMEARNRKVTESGIS